MNNSKVKLAEWEKHRAPNYIWSTDIVDQATYQNGYSLLAEALTNLANAEECFDSIYTLWKPWTLMHQPHQYHGTYDDLYHPLDDLIDAGMCPAAADGYEALALCLKKIDGAYSLSCAADAHGRESALRRDFEIQLGLAVDYVHHRFWALPPTCRTQFITGSKPRELSTSLMSECAAAITRRRDMCRYLKSGIGGNFWAYKKRMHMPVEHLSSSPAAEGPKTLPFYDWWRDSPLKHPSALPVGELDLRSSKKRGNILGFDSISEEEEYGIERQAASGKTPLYRQV
ncbi:hypothetical protein Cpir12675_002324 [Ceratocystis pirilliformis]|uniref:Uncharacterized protein n=1 Tax=Ceratocystis pirilliformis TaxID=259994 RepID=A0ABR3ZBX2_9PEZI